ncbi:MAG TPA: AAA family ATPase [Pyrinomonadaceae bacterium]|nr:AAA family ATPase [Pyrinomonadaceae bacterium]
MSEVFLSYRQTDDAQKQRVRAFGERLRAAGIKVILDQFFLDEHPEGPHEGWDKWSSDRALKTEYVLIIGTSEWFACFEKTEPPGTGFGSACEADDIRHMIYKAAGVIGHIRVVLFDDADAAHIPAKLDRYHRFHAERNFESIVRWLSHKTTVESPRLSIPHNLPSLQPFFGREDELRKIADALDPESRTWGALIDGPGGMGKTSLAIRAAYDLADTFEKIAFVSLKPRELDDDGVRDLSNFLISGLAELLNELARELGHSDITKATEDQRPRLLLNALRGTRTLLVLDNLESLIKRDRDIIFGFVKRLPPGCKAILTSRGRIGSAAEELILEKLTAEAALDTLAKLAENNPTLAKTTEEERIKLYRATGGNPLLLRWTAGQIGRGSCLTLWDAIEYLRSCPEGNNPLEFIFGDLVKDFSEAETSLLCALTYFSLPAKAQHIGELAVFPEVDTERALRSLVNRSLVVPTEELKTFTLVPLVADFLLKEKPNVVAETGDRLEKRVYALVVENGYRHYDRFVMLDADWPTVAAALPSFLSGPNDRLQTVCNALKIFLEFTGRWDEWLALSTDAEKRAVTAEDFSSAGWRVNDAAWVHYLREQSTEILTCADRAEDYWGHGSARERALALRLRGIGHSSAKDYAAAISAFRDAVDLWRTLSSDSEDLSIGLTALAGAEHRNRDLEAAERDYREALRIAEVLDYDHGIATSTSNLAELALDREDSPAGEALARRALTVSERIGRQELIASNCMFIARALTRQGKKDEALPYALRAVDIFGRLNSPRLAPARKTLAECDS